jgi:hypothetical protein
MAVTSAGDARQAVGCPTSAKGLGCVETFVHLSPEIFVTEPAGKLGIRRFGARNRFSDRERAL